MYDMGLGCFWKTCNRMMRQDLLIQQALLFFCSFIAVLQTDDAPETTEQTKINISFF